MSRREYSPDAPTCEQWGRARVGRDQIGCSWIRLVTDGMGMDHGVDRFGWGLIWVGVGIRKCAGDRLG